MVLCRPRHHHHRAVETAAPHLQLIIIIIQPGSIRGHTAWRHAPWPAPALTGETQSPYLHLTTTEHSGSSLPTSIIISLNSDTVTCTRLASPPPDRRARPRDCRVKIPCLLLIFHTVACLRAKGSEVGVIFTFLVEFKTVFSCGTCHMWCATSGPSAGHGHDAQAGSSHRGASSWGELCRAVTCGN